MATSVGMSTREEEEEVEEEVVEEENTTAVLLNRQTEEVGAVEEEDLETEFGFSALNPQSSSDKAGVGDDNEKHLETIQKDMEIWETSGQWVLSCYSVLKATISGFTELCPEELRLEYYNAKASGDLQSYASAVNQLANQWRSRVQELRTMNASTQAAMLAELDNPPPPATSGGFGSTPVTGFGSTPVTGFGSTPVTGFGSTPVTGFGSTPVTGFGSTPVTGFGSTPVTGFGSSAPTAFGIDNSGPTPAQNTTSPSTFSFAGPTTGGFGSATSQLPVTGFSNAVAPSASLFGSTASTTAPSASGFSFAAPAGKDSSTIGFAAPVSASGFSFASTSMSGAGGFGGGGFGQVSGAGGFGGGGFGQVSGGITKTTLTGGSAGSLFTPQSELTAEELKEFENKRFTLGQIPLKPPPAEMLVV
ncbi:hypothetical protein DPEC_G00289370 [Dallia pectoralis]|uniref:Uncharacterized protein n=1 Tax=Dallia pectoralis TaxID=75939 RepID=A0ACC2FL55_DALPE|nr:hypothetical protein DPEC_G00289370 [Dallia pectoralis]